MDLLDISVSDMDGCAGDEDQSRQKHHNDQDLERKRPGWKHSQQRRGLGFRV